MTIKIPRYQFDDNGNFIREEEDPAEARRYAINHCRNILTDTAGDGSPAYSQSMRERADRRLQELQQEPDN